MPQTLAEVSSDAITGLRRTVSAMVSASSAKGRAARRSMLARAPSDIVKPNSPPIISVRE